MRRSCDGTRQLLVATTLSVHIGRSLARGIQLRRLMAVPHRPQCFRCIDSGHGNPVPHPSPVLPQYPLRDGREQPALPNLPISPTHYQAVEEESAPAIRPIPYINGSRFFHVQEREYLSRPTSCLQIQIDIDLPHNRQAIGGHYPPPWVFSPHQNVPSQPPPPPSPPQQQSPSSSTSHGISSSQHQPSSERGTMQATSSLLKSVHAPQKVNPLPVAAESINNHPTRQRQSMRYHSEYPYPPSELRRRSPGITNDVAQRRHSPHAERRRAGRKVIE